VRYVGHGFILVHDFTKGQCACVVSSSSCCVVLVLDCVVRVLMGGAVRERGGELSLRRNRLRRGAVHDRKRGGLSLEKKRLRRGAVHDRKRRRSAGIFMECTPQNHC
jgi:hypothetical protein